MREFYERPIIMKRMGGFLNKFSWNSKLDVIDKIDGNNVTDLLKEFGSPLFVFSEEKIRKQYKRFLYAFKSKYEKFQFAWSYKTNYLQTITSIYHTEGSIAEVVSEFEYKKAKKMGIEPCDIIYNGPYKSYESLIEATKDGAKIHIDHFEELLTLEKISDELNIKPKVAIRINMDTGIYPSWDRFGFNFENGEAKQAVKRIVQHNKMNFIGIHSHIGTFVISPDAYEKLTQKMVKFYKEIKEEFNITLEYIDLGGGLPSQNKLKSQYLPSSILIPSVEQYAEKITDVLIKNFDYNNGPKVFMEAGRALIDDAGYLLTTIHATKRLPDGRKAIILDGGVNILFTAYFYDLNVYPAQTYQGTMENTIIYGPLCMNIDVVRESILLPPFNTGDNLVLNPVGAYNVTQWMQFIQMRPAVVLINLNEKPVLIRRKETIEDVELPEILPDNYKLVE